MELFYRCVNVKYILSGTFFSPTSIKIENQTVSTKKMTKKEEPLNLNLVEPSEVKSLALVFLKENFKNQSLTDVQLIQELS